MLRLALKLPARSQNLFQYAAYTSSAPNSLLRLPDLDPGLQELLNEYEIPDINKLSEPRQRSGERKSPAAVFGSQRIGMLILPSELQSAINQLIKGMHPMKMAIVIVHVSSQRGKNHKFGVMPNGYFNLTQTIERNLSGTRSMNRTMVPNCRLFAMPQEMGLPLLLLPFRHIIPP